MLFTKSLQPFNSSPTNSKTVVTLTTQKRFERNLAIAYAKGQLISKCPFGVIVWTKIPTKKFPEFLP